MKAVKIAMCTMLFCAFISLNDALAQWAPNGTHIYNTNPDYVGIGNMTPTTLLHVGKFMGEPTIKIHNQGAGGGATFQMVDDLSAADWKFKSTTTGAFKIRDQASGLDVIYIEKNSLANVMYVDAIGHIAMRHNQPDGHGLNVINYTAGKAAVQGLSQEDASTYASGMLGLLNGPALGLPVFAWNIGVLGIKGNPSGSNNGAGVFGWNTDAVNTDNYGGIFVADGTAANGTNYGTYGMAKHAASNYAGKFLGRVAVDGHVNSTDAPDYTSNVFESKVNHAAYTDTRAILGISQPQPGWGIGVEGLGNWIGVRGEGTTEGGTSYGVLGTSGGSAGTHYAVYGSASGTGTGSRIGIYGIASGGDNSWAGYFSGDAYISSDLRIATTTQATGYALSVNGKIACEEVLVEDLASWPDYVFAEDYKLMSIDELEKSIEQNNHLPGLPSAAEIEENGLSLGDMQKRMIEKIEELTLYTIQQNKMIRELQEELEILKKENARFTKHSK